MQILNYNLKRLDKVRYIMIISSFNINKFCGPYSYKGRYYNPKNLDFKSKIKEIVQSLLKNKNDIFFLQEFIDNGYIKAEELFPAEKYKISNYPLAGEKSNVVAITLKDSEWIKKEQNGENELKNKFVEMELKKTDSVKCHIFCFHNTDTTIKNKVNTFLYSKNSPDIVLGDFNDMDWIKELQKADDKFPYRDLVTNDMITFKPAQTAIDRILIKKKYDDNCKIVFNGIYETFASDHNLLSFSIDI